MQTLLEVKNLSISFPTPGGKENRVVNNSNFSLKKGTMVALVGESGSGKSVSALSILKLLHKKAKVEGSILYHTSENKTIDLAKADEHTIREIRGQKIAMIFQEPMTSLNPAYTCGNQVIEALRAHKNISAAAARQKAIDLFKEVQLPNPTAMLKRYPHEISGGQKQRVMIAMAMCCEPDLLIADEPTTALDVRVQKNILELIKKLQVQNNLSVLLITHDLALVADVADEIVVMYKSEIVEKGAARQILNNPEHVYTKALMSCRPTVKSKGKPLPVLADFLEEKEEAPIINTQNNSDHKIENLKVEVLKVENVSVVYGGQKNIFGKTNAAFKAVDDVSFSIYKNETVGLVGESGCGKTTLGRAILQLVKPSSGNIFLKGTSLTNISDTSLRQIRPQMQIVFQDPYGSLNPRITIGEAIAEPLKVHRFEKNKNNRKDKVISLLQDVSLLPEYYHRYPHEFSGGQRQRICIARALAMAPEFLIFDESVSALDVSVQAQVLNLINSLKAAYNLTCLFISHDLSVVHYISDRILVMNQGKIVESGLADDVFFRPQNPYAQELLAAIPGRSLV